MHHTGPVRRVWSGLLLVGVVGGACTPVTDPADGRSEPGVEAPILVEETARSIGTTTGGAPTDTVRDPDPEPVWSVGAEPLPLRPDGFGEVLPTPEVLVDRDLPTASALPPPRSDEYASSIAPVDDEVRARMGETWQEGCPVGLDELRYVTMSFWGIDGAHHTGEMVLHQDVAADVVWVFAQLHAERFPIEEMRLITTADLHAPATGDGNNSASFVCRPIRGGSSWSEHAYGRAVDVNPFHNPYERGDVVLPELASAYLDREHHRRGMVHRGDVVVESFAAIGWSWGGDWSSPDYMHFSLTGR